MSGRCPLTSAAFAARRPRTRYEAQPSGSGRSEWESGDGNEAKHQEPIKYCEVLIETNKVIENDITVVTTVCIKHIKYVTKASGTQET